MSIDFEQSETNSIEWNHICQIISRENVSLKAQQYNTVYRKLTIWAFMQKDNEHEYKLNVL